jgi:hypothetical protein
MPFTAFDFDIILNKVKSTSPGPDCIPHWFLRACASHLSPVLSKIVNHSLCSSCVPTAWRQAVVTPVPKTLPVTGPSDFRPISVTSILSRITEKLIVKKFLSPYLYNTAFYDQYAYKPTGSTTCALIDFTYRINMLLESNQFVRCVFVDFSKAFDMVDHAILIRKLCMANVPTFIIKWIISFLTDRMQATTFLGKLSTLMKINRSIVQGSGIGPTLFIMFACDLKPIDSLNYLLKYVDDSTLIVLKSLLFLLKMRWLTYVDGLLRISW